jgi:hypothetical protein
MRAEKFGKLMLSEDDEEDKAFEDIDLDKLSDNDDDDDDDINSEFNSIDNLLAHYGDDQEELSKLSHN